MNTRAADRAAARFRPRPLSAALALLGFAILIALGTWQVERLHWKEALIAERAARLALPPLAAATAPDDPAAFDLRRVRLAGTFVEGRELVYGPRAHNGQSGWRVIVPLKLDDGSYALVDRGWVPDDRKDPRTRAGAPAGRVEIVGILRTSGRRGAFTPDDDPARGQWYTADVARMAAHLGLAPVRPWLVEAGPAPNSRGFPIGGGTLAPLPNDHLQYAITWYLLAVALVVIYILANRRRS
jgi:surfeit locus 1 family protein